MNPRFPIYIVSRSRWERRPTSKSLELMKVPYYIIVDADQYDKYCSVIDKKKVLVMPEKYAKEYDMFWNDSNKITGPGAARNFAWEHSIKNCFKRHWVLDDNIEGFYRLHNNVKMKVPDGTIFRVMEDFTLRYDNVAISGPNYDYFAKAMQKIPPFIKNTRIYSCLFIRNDIPYRWRGRYNEDTDLCLRVLKDGYCTIQFNAFLQGKAGTQTMKGGNTDQFYIPEGTFNKSKMLKDMHPDLTTIVWKFHRWHHHVDYRKFKKNKLIRNYKKLSKKIDNYGMKIIK